MDLSPVYQLPLFVFEKTCTKCGEVKPLSDFYAQRASKDGVTARCKACIYTVKPPKPAYVAPTVKPCTQCCVVKPLSEFKRTKAMRDGHYSWCKACDGVLHRAYRLAHPEKINARRRRYYYRHQEEEQAKALAYRNEHREKYVAYNRLYHAANLEEERAKRRAYRQAHPEKHRAWARQHREEIAERSSLYRATHRVQIRIQQRAARRADPLYPLKNRLYSHKRRGTERAAEGNYALADIQALEQAQCGACAYCGAPYGKYHIEHKQPLSRGGSNWPSNLCLACATCNLRKRTKTDREFIAWLQDHV